MPKLTVNNLGFMYETVPIFSHLSFVLNGGEILLIKGENGSGKTTLLRVIGGLLPPSAGTLQWETAPSSLFIATRYSPLPKFTPYEMICYWAVLYQVHLKKEEIHHVLSHMKLDHVSSIPNSMLSEGQRQRLSLSRCLFIKKHLWILDEPTLGLDSSGRHLLFDFFDTHRARGGSIIIASHDAHFENLSTLNLFRPHRG